jgi:formiminotetrahydrofolate cyclodeaminase
VPLAICAAALKALRASEALVEIVNPMLVSDVAVGATLAEAAFRAAQVNVEINLNGMKDTAFVTSTRGKVEADARAARQIHDRVAAAAGRRMTA